MSGPANADVDLLLAESSAVARRLMRAVHEYFVEAGCAAYVKTI
jgi:hypothetical protein